MTIDYILSFLSNNVLPFTILGALLGVGSLYLKNKNNSIAEQNLKMNEVSFENGEAKFNIYLEDSYRYNFKIFDKRKIILFKINIINQSKTTNSFNAELIIEYSNENDENCDVILTHSPILKELLPQKDLSVLLPNIAVEGKNMISGWLIFEQPQSLSQLRVNKFRVMLTDVDGNSGNIESVLIKDILHEI